MFPTHHASCRSDRLLCCLAAFILLGGILPGSASAQSRQFPQFESSAHMRRIEVELDRQAEQARKVVELWVIAVIVGITCVILGVGGWLYIRSRATTDPKKLAINDPWMREHLASLSPEEREQALASLAEGPVDLVRVTPIERAQLDNLLPATSPPTPDAITATPRAGSTRGKPL